MEVTPDDYIIDISANGGTCSVCFSGYPSIDYWILGDAFMRGWYTIHDHTNMRMGFVPYTGSSKGVPIEATSIPTIPLPLVEIIEYFRFFGMDADDFLIYVILLGLITCACVCCFVYCCYSLLFKT